MLLAFAPAAYNRLQRWLHKTYDGRGLAAVTDIVITHMHMDHVGGLNVDGVKAKLRPDEPGSAILGRSSLPSRVTMGALTPVVTDTAVTSCHAPRVSLFLFG